MKESSIVSNTLIIDEYHSVYNNTFTNLSLPPDIITFLNNSTEATSDEWQLVSLNCNLPVDAFQTKTDPLLIKLMIL